MTKESKGGFIKTMISRAVGDNAFVNMVAGLGTVRDKAAHAEYVQVKRKSVNELNNIYHQDWIARRIIDKPAEDSVRAGWYFKNVTPEQNQAIIALTKKIKLKKLVMKAMVLARLHGWSYILIGSNDSESLEDELDIGIDDLSFLTVLERDVIKPQENGEVLSAMLTCGRMNEPVFYQVGNVFEGKLIHHSRIIRIDAPDYVGGKDGMPMPLLQYIYDTLMRQVSVSANASSLVYESKVDIIKVPDLMDSLDHNAADTVNSMIKRFAAVATMKGNNGMMVLDAEEDYDSKSYSFGGLPELMREFSVQTAGAANMPYSLLFGQSPSGMNATGNYDMQTYYDSISFMQESSVREPLEAIYEMITKSLGIDVNDIGIVFESLWQIDPKELSEIERNNAERDMAYLEKGIVTESFLAQQLVDDGTYTTITDSHIQLLKQLEGQTYEDADEIGYPESGKE